MPTDKESEVRLNDEGKRIPTKADGHTAMLRYLMTYCVCPVDTDYNIHAVDSLLRKLQNRKKHLHELIETITWRGTRPSKCFTIPRTLDGRFQVGTRKGFPHVVYARIWRWADLEKCQIIHISTCKYGYDLNREDICVNPYHYKKIKTVEEIYSKLTASIIAEANKNKLTSQKKSTEAACSQNIAVKDGEKKQDLPQQQQSNEILIPIVVEHRSNAAKYIEPQQSQLVSNNIEEPKVQPQDNFEKMINLPAPSNTLLVNNPPLVSNCDQPSQNLVRGDVGSVPTNEMPPPRKIPLSSNSRLVNRNRKINLPPPSSTPLPHNPPTFSDSLFVDEDFQPIERQHNELPTSCSKKSENKDMSLNYPIERILKEGDNQQTTNNNPLKTQDSNQQLKLISNAPNLIHNIEAVSPISDVPPKKYSQKFENKDTSLNYSIEGILKEGDSQQTAKNNPLENTLNETLDQILSEVQSSNQKLSNTDQKLESNNTKPMTTPYNIEKVLNSNEDLAYDNVSTEVSNYKEKTQDNSQKLQLISNAPYLIQNIKVVSSISNLPSKNYSQKFENKETLNSSIERILTEDCTLEQALKEDDSQQTASNSSLENTIDENILSEFLILPKVQNNDQNNDKKLSSTEQNLENLSLNETREPMITKSNFEKVLNSNEDLADDNVPMKVGNYEEKTQYNNQQLQLISNAPNLIQNIKVVSPITNIPSKNYSQKLENKDSSLNCSLERILTEDCTLKEVLKKNDSQQTASNNPLENTLNETLDQILSQVQSNNQTLSNTDEKLESAVLSNNTERMITKSNIEKVLNSNEDLADDNVPMEVGNYEEKTQDNNQQLQLISNAPNLVQNIEAISPVSDVPPKNYSQKFENKDYSLNFSIEGILKEGDSQQTASNNPLENTLNETLDQILSQVQSNDQILLNTDQKLESNNTEPMKTHSNIEKVLNNNEDLVDDNVPMEVHNYEEAIEQNDNQQLQPISNASELTQNIRSISPISSICSLSSTSASSLVSSIRSITPPSPTSIVRSQSPISNTQSLSPEQFQSDSTLLSLDSDDNKNTGECSKLIKKRRLSDNTDYSDEDLQETMTRNNNKPKNTLHFSDTIISSINNNMEQTQMSPVSKCEQYLRNQCGETESSAYVQSPTNNNNTNPAQQVPKPGKSQDSELQQSNFNEFFNMPNLHCRNTKNLIPKDDPPLEYWCMINYFELDIQVGDPFKVKNEHTTVVVDGYLDPDGGSRFSLGRLTNLRRTEQSKRTMLHIAQGIALELRDEGDIWLTCRSKTSVFIKAHFLDIQSDPSSRNTVHKIFSGECKKVFDLQRCYKHLKAQIATAQAAHKGQLTPGRSINNLSGSKGLEAMGMNIDDLRRLCILQISFVKGWGSDYPRQTIKETPCWIEVHISKAMQILDNFLHLEKPIVRGMD